MPKNYILRNVEDGLWQRLKAAAALKGLSVRQVIIAALERFVEASGL